MGSKFWAEFSKELFVDKFVGRQEPLAIVDQAIKDAPNNHLITFVGEAGIGKTALLRNIYQTYEANQSLVILTFDFSLSGLNSVLSLVQRMKQHLLEQGFFTTDDLVSVENRIKRVYDALSKGEREEIIRDLEDATYREFAKVFGDQQKKLNQRLLILADSLEHLSENLMVSQISLLFDNAVLVLAWRPNNDLKRYFESDLPKAYRDEGWTYKGPVVLGHFSFDETTNYFTKLLPSPLEPELIETIYILTEGKPILLALTIEWFKHYVDLPRHVNKSKEELEAFEPLKLQMFRRHFKMALVRRVRAVRSPLDKALLFLSFLDRRYDNRILQLALKRPIEEIEKLEPQLRSMAFSRSFLDHSSGLLHEEAKYLINEYAWPPYDPKRTDRRLLARKVIDGLYLPEIEKLRAEIATMDASDVPTQLSRELKAHELEMECLDYHYRISLDEGRRYVTQLIREAVGASLAGALLRKREGMRHEITKRVGEHEAKVAVARLELRRGQLERKVLAEALKDEELSDWYRMTLLAELSEAVASANQKAAT